MRISSALSTKNVAILATESLVFGGLPGSNAVTRTSTTNAIPAHAPSRSSFLSSSMSPPDMSVVPVGTFRIVRPNGRGGKDRDRCTCTRRSVRLRELVVEHGPGPVHLGVRERGNVPAHREVTDGDTHACGERLEHVEVEAVEPRRIG